MDHTRNTRQKQLILSILTDAREPLTAGDIYARGVLVQPRLAKSTVYRNLDAMAARGELIRGLLENGESFYTPAQGHAHRHYMICRGCNAMLDLPECPLASREETYAKEAGFFVTGHVVQLYGYCRDCARKRKMP